MKKLFNSDQFWGGMALGFLLSGWTMALLYGGLL